jgi:sporulation protein YlmC with PRC-barrel domain
MLSLNAIAIIGALYVLVWVADQARPVRRESVRPLDYESGISISYSSSQEKQIERNSSPFFEARTIEKAILSDDKVLRDSSRKKIGFLEKAIFSNNQIIRDSEGKKVGSIEESILDKAVWGLNIQTIKDSKGKKIGEISTGFFGDRVITDSRGKKVGTIRKGFLGETVIDHSGEGEDWVSFAINVGIAVMAFIALLTYLLLKSLYIGIKYAAQQLNTKIKARKMR